jgi:cytochrome c553
MHTFKSMSTVAFVLVSVALVLAATRKPQTGHAERLQRGQYLVEYGGCADCHTPQHMTSEGARPDRSRWLAGHPEDAQLPPPPKLPEGPWFAVTAGLTAWSGPWGISYAANLTPDELTGIGIWTEDLFLKTMRTGKHMGAGRDILPPMPWQGLAKLSDDDLKAIYAYLRSIPPVRNRVPDPASPCGANPFE